MYLVDTNVLSASAPSQVRPHTQLLAWMHTNSLRLFLSVVTIAEVEDGIAKARREGASRKADRLAAWLDMLLHLYSSRIRPFDLAAARIAGGLADRARGEGHAPGFADIAIAATALEQGYTILTRNLSHFTPLGVPAHDPFTSLPP